METYEASLKYCHLNCFIDKTVDKNDWGIYAESARGH